MLDPAHLPISCRTCGAGYLDDEDDRAAHRAVFGHRPHPRPTEPREEDEDA